ncbi:hypothetical protein GR217_34280 [Rhizobium leguminosarum]|uniref:Uncharacterized protein n=1 Tax=Rhizobium ruizarguesonis TaxID=2081791 RepID=A0AAE4YZ15_9HYPH|nr:hypothetical protein [Rhizobium ruizarguesonis]NEI52688.1 hypothetical protein [Rhizobium ruizarguesonis]
MHTKDFLAGELEKAGLPEMAKNARAGMYHDFLSPLPFPEMQLDLELNMAVESGNEAAAELRKRHHAGEFDASFEESEEWAESADGKDALAQLFGGMKS